MFCLTPICPCRRHPHCRRQNNISRWHRHESGARQNQERGWSARKNQERRWSARQNQERGWSARQNQERYGVQDKTKKDAEGKAKPRERWSARQNQERGGMQSNSTKPTDARQDRRIKMQSKAKVMAGARPSQRICWLQCVNAETKTQV